MNIYRGDIYYIENSKYFDVEYQANTNARPAIIVSNDKSNQFTDECTVVYLTRTNDAPQIPTHVPVICKVPSIAKCETVCRINQRRVGEFIRACSAAEMEAVEKGLMAQLGIETSGKTAKELEALEEEAINARKALDWSESERAKLTAELEKRDKAYKELDEKRAALEAELNGERCVSDGYGREVAMLHEERDRLNAKLEEYRTKENLEIRKLKDALDAEKENSLLYKAQLDAQTTANEELRRMLTEAETKMDVTTAAYEQEAEEPEKSEAAAEYEDKARKIEEAILSGMQAGVAYNAACEENIRLKAEIDVYKGMIGKLIPQLA